MTRSRAWACVWTCVAALSGAGCTSPNPDFTGDGTPPVNGDTGTGGSAGTGVATGTTGTGATTGTGGGTGSTGTGGAGSTGTGGSTGASNAGQTPAKTYLFQQFDGLGDHSGGTTVNGLNNAGAVVGFSASTGATTLTNFVRTPDGKLAMLNLGSKTAVANAINMSQEVAGVSGTNAILETNTVVTSLKPPLPGETKSEEALGLNDAGTIVGKYTTNAGATLGFLFAGNAYVDVAPVGAASTNAQGVNKMGLVIGFFSTAAQLGGKMVAGNPAQQGFLFDSVARTYEKLPVPTEPNLFLAQFLAINDYGLAVGYWQDTAGSQHGFFYNVTSKIFTFIDEPNAKPINGVSITQIVGINNAGAIAGFYVDANGVQRGFYATPQ